VKAVSNIKNKYKMKKIIQKFLILFLTGFIIFKCGNETNLTIEESIIENNTVTHFLVDVKSLESDTNVNPIVVFNDLAEKIADYKIFVTKDNIKEVLIKARDFSSSVIVTANHTIVKIKSLDDCQQSGSWKACMPKCEGYIKKGVLNFKEDYMNNIIGIPDNQERVAYFFNSNQFVQNEGHEGESNSTETVEKIDDGSGLNQNSEIYDYELYKVTSSDKWGEVGSIITVYDKLNHSSFTIDDGAIYFEALIDHYVILDEGTGPDRIMIIYDLKNQNIVFESGYCGVLEFNDSKIEFKDQVEISNEQAKPECPQELLDIGYGIGYSEKLIFDLTTLKLERTGIYECQYFQ